MARNVERDSREAKRRRQQLMEAGYRLFSQYGIEAVCLQRVADEADVGAATMYKYFQSKENLVIAISGKVWGEVWQETLNQYGQEKLAAMTAFQLIHFYADLLIALYQQRPELLSFSSNYKSFIRHQQVAQELLKEHLNVLDPVRALFHNAYERAKTDGSIRTDLPEQQMFTTVSITLLSLAERYAQGLVWANDQKTDHTQELLFLKEMLLAWCTGKTL